MNKAEFWSFLRDELDGLSNALEHKDSKDVRAICSKLRSRLEEIREAAADELESQARREIEKRPHDDEEYDTSEDEQSKSHEDGEEILERRAEADRVLTGRYELDFSDLIDDFEKLSRVPREEAFKMTTALKAKVPPAR
jgi:predicted  nucleic acid-binding Zn-ribbon protein